MKDKIIFGFDVGREPSIGVYTKWVCIGGKWVLTGFKPITEPAKVKCLNS